MADTPAITSFTPDTKLNNGNAGLGGPKNSQSSATIMGSYLIEGLVVTVLRPAQSQHPHFKWTGLTASAQNGNTTCRVQLQQQLTRPIRDTEGDDPATVSVTVGGSTPYSTPNPIPLGSPSTLLDGVYTVHCNGTSATTFQWLAPKSDNTGVELASAAVNWIFTQVSGGYTILYRPSATTYYLNWTDNGPNSWGVSLVTGLNGQNTTWQINADCIMPIGATQYLNGNTDNGIVDLRPQPDLNSGTSWALALS